MIFLLTFASEEERDKFEYLYTKYKNLLIHQAYAILKDVMQAEDAVSEAFLRVYKNLDKIEDPDSNRSISFLVTIVKNVAFTMYQKKKRETVDSFDLDLPDKSEMELDIIGELNSKEIFAVVGRLDEVSKNIFVLKFAYDLSHKEIAESLGITENNVTVKLHRAKKKLAEILVKEGYADARES